MVITLTTIDLIILRNRLLKTFFGRHKQNTEIAVY